MNFSTKELSELIPLLDKALVIKIIEDFSGDYATKTITVSHPDFLDDSILITGFSTSPLDSDDDCEVEMLELKNKKSFSPGGVESNIPYLMFIATILKIALQEEGFTIVNNLKDYF